MKIVVCVKEVPPSPVRSALDPGTLRLVRSGDRGLNGADKQALEIALRFRDADPEGVEVVLLSLAPERAVSSLQEGMAMGADRSILVSDPAAAGSDLVATGRVLARALDREPSDLVLVGAQSSDSNGAMLWATIGERLDRPVVSQVSELSVLDGVIRARRQTENGYEVVEARLPAIVAVSNSVAEPRYALLKGMIAAKKKRCDVLGLGDLGLGPADAGVEGSRTTVLAARPAPPRKAPELMAGDDPAAAAEALLERLIARGIV